MGYIRSHRGQFSSVEDLIPGVANIPRETKVKMLNKLGNEVSFVR